jgi:hypothetical protein
MKRRAFIAALGGAVAWPMVARAQLRPAKIARIGIIDYAVIWDHFLRGLRELGYTEGRMRDPLYSWYENQTSNAPLVRSAISTTANTRATYFKNRLMRRGARGGALFVGALEVAKIWPRCSTAVMPVLLSRRKA